MQHSSQMTNDEWQMTKEARNPNDEELCASRHSGGFELRASSFFRHSSFGIRHLAFPIPLHAGTFNFLSASSTTPRAVWPEKRACGSITNRCAITDTAIS